MSTILRASLILGGLGALGVGVFLLSGSGDVDEPGFSIGLRDFRGDEAECSATLWRESDGKRHATESSSKPCEAGRLSWTNLQPGIYRLIAHSPESERLEKQVKIDFKFVDLGTVDLQKGMRLQGKVWMEGDPVADALILVEGGRRSRSDAEGRFSIDGLPLKELEVRAAAQAGRGAIRVLPEMSNQDISFELTRGKGQGLLGLQFDLKERGPVVTALLPGSGAAAELEPGDLLLQVDGVGVLDLSKDEVAQILSGETGSKSSIQIERAGETRDVLLSRMDPVELVE